MSDFNDGWDLDRIPKRFWPIVDVARAMLSAAVLLEEVGKRLPGEMGEQFAVAVREAVAALDDDICPPPPKRPHPHPNTVMTVASDLVSFAAALPEGSALAATTLDVARGVTEPLFGSSIAVAQR